MPDDNPIHATSVMIDGRVLLLTGRSGSGKSDLALRLIDRGALLVSDDYTALLVRDGILLAGPPARLAGRIEVRGVGLVELPFAGEGPVALLLDLDAEPARMPDERLPEAVLCGVAVPRLSFKAFDGSAPVKAEHALKAFGLAAGPVARP